MKRRASFRRIRSREHVACGHRGDRGGDDSCSHDTRLTTDRTTQHSRTEDTFYNYKLEDDHGRELTSKRAGGLGSPRPLPLVFCMYLTLALPSSKTSARTLSTRARATQTGPWATELCPSRGSSTRKRTRANPMSASGVRARAGASYTGYRGTARLTP